MLEFLGIMFLVGLSIWLAPIIIATCLFFFCLIMAGICWIKEKLSP